MGRGFYFQQMMNIGNNSGKYRVSGLFLLCLFLGAGLPSVAQTINNFAGTGVCCGWGPENGPATTALFTSIGGLAADDTGNLYISDASSIRKVNKSGFIVTIAGTTGSAGTIAGYSGDNGPATAAKMQSGVADVAVDNLGNLYICDSGNNVIRKVNASGIITTFAGTGVSGFSGDGLAATVATFNGPKGIAIDRAGNIFVADYNNKRVRIINTSGIINTYAGSATLGYSGDGGMATAAEMSHPSHLAFDNSGNLYITDYGNVVVRKVNTTGIISTYAGTGISGYSGDGGPASAAKLNMPGGLAFDAANNLYIGDGAVVRRVSASGIISTVAGDDINGYAGDAGLATAAKINTAFVAVDDSGNLFLNQASQAVRVVKGIGAIDDAPVFNLGPLQSYSVCISSTSNSINSLFPVRDLDAGQTETWRIYSAPSHGALGGFPYSAISTGGIISPTGLTYTPTSGYSGSDEFTIQVYDGYTVDTTHINITVLPLSTAGSITGTTDICTGSVALFTDAAASGAWTSSNSAVATVGSANGIVSGVGAGTALISYSVNACGTASVSMSVVIAAGTPINPVTGTTTICAGTSTPLNDLTTDGTWESSNTSVATINSSAILTGVTAGTAVIIYTTMQTCGVATATASVTVNTTPATGTIYGITNICAGTITTLGETVSSGIWSSSNSSVVSIGSSSGAATGVMVGSATVSYALTNTCGTSYATSFVYVTTIPTVSAISGSASLCAGSSTTLTDPTTGGTWSSSHAAIASIGSTSGSSDGVTAGTAIITYSVANSCGTGIATLPVTIGSLSTLAAITGTTTFCQGSGATLSDDTTGGTWSSSNTAVATIGSSSGIVAGIAPGTSVIMYAATVTCGVATTSATVTVNPLPVAGLISGVSNLCSGSFSTFTDASTGGIWSTSNSAVATVGSSSGTVTGVTSGTALISYTATNTCGTALATALVTIGGTAPIGAVTGTTTICPGETVTLSDTTAGGTWSSANTSVAAIGTAPGTVTGTGTGSTQIIYTATLSCGIATATTTVTVNPAPSLTSTTTPPAICSGSLFSYVPASSYGGATFSWSRPVTPGISNPSAGGSGDIAEALDNSTFYGVSVTYYYTIMALGCTSHRDVTVTVLPIPRLSSGTSDTVCSGSTFNYTPTSLTSGVSYTWSRSAVSGISPATATGTGNISEALTNGTSSSLIAVYLYALSADGCTSAADVNLLVTPQPAVATITTQSPSAVCSNTLYQNFGASVAPGSGISYTWSAINADVWDIGSTNQYCLVNFPSSGTALVILTASVGSANCIVNDTVSVTVSSSVSTSAGVIYFDGQFAYLNNLQDSYQWGYDNVSTLDSSIIPGATFQTYPNATPDFTDNYYWVITTYGGCMEKTYYNVPMAVKNINNNAVTLKVYPDPAANTLNVDLQGQHGGKIDVEIMDILGQPVRTQTTSGSTLSFDVSDLPAACYLISSSQNGVKTGNARFIKN